jgi:hypothetical protein
MVYLYTTRYDGLYYWRPEPNKDLPDIPLPDTVSSHKQLKDYQKFLQPTQLDGASNSTWATNTDAPPEASFSSTVVVQSTIDQEFTQQWHSPLLKQNWPS